MTQSPLHEGQLEAPFIERTYREVMGLVQETASYLEHDGLIERAALEDTVRTVFAGESLRVTTRLMQAVAWLLVHRAVAQGEMSPSEGLAPDFRLGGREICLGPPMQGVENLPDRLLLLLDASRQIYERISRLEDRLIAGDLPDNPVHGLLKRLDF